MYVLVPDETGDECQNGNDYDRRRARDPRLIAFADRSESQSASDTVDRTPPHTCDRIQNYYEAIRKVEGEREPGKRQLTEAELRAECEEIGDGNGSEKVEEDDGEEGGPKLETKYGGTESPEGKAPH